MPYIRVPKLSGSHPLVMANAVQVRLFWNFAGVHGFNVLNGRVAGGFANSPTHATNLATAVMAAWDSSDLRNRQPTTVSLDGVGIRDLRTAHQVEYVDLSLTDSALGTDNLLARQLACCVTLKTPLAGKSYRGRVYIGGANEDQNNSNGHMVTDYMDACLAFVTGVQAAMLAEGITLAILSAPRYANLTPPLDVQTWPGALTDVNSITILDELWDEQRRRKT